MSLLHWWQGQRCVSIGKIHLPHTLLDVPSDQLSVWREPAFQYLCVGTVNMAGCALPVPCAYAGGETPLAYGSAVQTYVGIRQQVLCQLAGLTLFSSLLDGSGPSTLGVI